jgi:hypothetical protein
LDKEGINKVRQWSYIASLLARLDKNVHIVDELVQKIVLAHINEVASLTELQLFEFMYFVIANHSVV